MLALLVLLPTRFMTTVAKPLVCETTYADAENAAELAVVVPLTVTRAVALAETCGPVQVTA